MTRSTLIAAYIAAATSFSSHAQSVDQAPAAQEAFLECKGTQTVCTPKIGCANEQKKYVIAWKGNSIRHLDDYGIMEYAKGCEVTDRWVYCSEKTAPNGVGGKEWRQRRTIFERATGNVEHSYRQDSTEEGADLDRKGGPLPTWLLKFQGACTPRAKANLF